MHTYKQFLEKLEYYVFKIKKIKNLKYESNITLVGKQGSTKVRLWLFSILYLKRYYTYSFL